MEMTKTRLTLACAIALMANINSANADLAADADMLFNWGEKAFPQLLSEPQTTQTMPAWYFRYYTKTDLYVGINRADKSVYTLSGKPGAEAIYIDSVPNLLQQVAALNPPVNEPPVNVEPQVTEVPLVEPPVQTGSSVCDTANAPQGVAYNESGNNVRITTGGQCVPFPRTDICLPKSPAPGGISVLKRLEIQNYSLQGIDFAIPSMAQAVEPQIKSNGSIKSCIKNAPQEFANISFDLDGCFDVTERVKDFPSIEGLVKVSPPVTMQLQGNFVTETVSDCFNTDAAIVTDAVTNEVWDKKGGVFVKR
ncbi:MAG: hypothetical protein ABL903_10525 [Methylococcales bacterium]